MQDNKPMLNNLATQINHHAKELKSLLSSSDEIEAWVLAKAERSATDLSDITHYLEGVDNVVGKKILYKFIEGENMSRKAIILKDNGDSYLVRIIDNGDMHNRETNVKKDNVIQIFERHEYVNGGMMADGGKIKVGDRVELLNGMKGKIVKLSDSFRGGGRYYVVETDEKYGKNRMGIPKDQVKKLASGGYMAKGGGVDEVNTEVTTIKRNIMGTTSMMLKIKGMKKPQEFDVYPITADQAGKPIMIQSDTRIGFLDLKLGKGLMSQSHANGAYSYHYALDKKVPFIISETDLKRIKEHIANTMGSKVGSSGIFSDNSGASMMAEGGYMAEGCYVVNNLGGNRYNGGIVYNITKDDIIIHEGLIDGNHDIEFDGKSYDGLVSLAKALNTEVIFHSDDYYANGGMMAKGGEIDMNVIVKTPKGIVTKKDFEGFTKKEIIEWCEERGWVYNPKGEKLGGRILKEYEFFIKSPTKYNVTLPKKSDGGFMAKGGELVAKYKVGDMVYSYQNKNYLAPINFVKFVSWDINKGSHPNDKYVYRLSLTDGNSNWISEESLSNSKMAEGGYMAKGGNFEKPIAAIIDNYGNIESEKKLQNDLEYLKDAYEDKNITKDEYDKLYNQKIEKIKFLKKKSKSGYMEHGGDVSLKVEYIIKDGSDKYFARGLSDGNIKWNDSQDMAYIFSKSEAESFKSNLELEGYSNLSVQKYDKDWWKKMSDGGYMAKGGDVKKYGYADGGYMANGVEIMKHKHYDYITIELIEPTNKGWKVKQIETHTSYGKKLSKPKEKIAYYSKDEIKDLFKPYMEDGGMMAKGGFTYKDLSKEKPLIVNDSDIKSKTFKVEEVDLYRKGMKTFEGNAKITNSESAVKIFRQFWDEEALSISEHMNVMLLNRANKIIGVYQHSKGGVTGTVLEPQMIVLAAVKSLAKGVIVAHNHPSGNLKPSDADIKITKKVGDALKLVDINLLDSLIISEDGYFSLAEEGYMAKGGMMADGGKIKVGDFVALKKDKNVTQVVDSLNKDWSEWEKVENVKVIGKDKKGRPIFTKMSDGGYMENGGEIATMSEKEFINKYFGANVFTEDVSKYFDIKKISSSNDAKIDKFIEDHKRDGYTIKKKSYSDFTYVMAVKKKMSDGGYMAKGGVTFADKVDAVKSSLLKRKKVSPSVQKDYGKTYSPKEAEDSAKRIVGSQVAKYKKK